MAGFDAVNVHAGIPQQAVAVHLANIVKGEFFLFVDRVFIWYIADQRLTNQCHIACGAVLAIGIQTVNGLEVGVLKT